VRIPEKSLFSIEVGRAVDVGQVL